MAELAQGSTAGGSLILTKKNIPINIYAQATEPTAPGLNDIWLNISKPSEPKIKYWSGSAWIETASKDADTVDGLHASSFLQKASGDLDGYFYTGDVAPTGTTRLNYSGYFYATRIYNAVWNDYAEFFLKDEECEPGDVLAKNPTGKGYIKATSKIGKLVVGVVSDSYGHCLGGESGLSEEEQLKKYAPVGLAGRVNVKVTGTVEIGDLLIASDIPGVAIAAPPDFIPGTVIGKALEKHSGTKVDRIKMLIMRA